MMLSMIILADATPDPKAFQQFWVIVAFLAGVAVNVVTMIIALSNRKQKAEISFGFTPASREEFLRHQDENKIAHDRFDVRIGGVDRKTKEHADVGLERLRTERKEDMRALHTEINEVGKEVSALKATNVIQNQRLTEISAKLDRAIERRSE